eukprot:Selendium_serpulae@DN11202_c0_g1_i1.p1
MSGFISETGVVSSITLSVSHKNLQRWDSTRHLIGFPLKQRKLTHRVSVADPFLSIHLSLFAFYCSFGTKHKLTVERRMGLRFAFCSTSRTTALDGQPPFAQQPD